MSRLVSRTSILSAVVPFALFVGCGGSTSKTDAKKDAVTETVADRGSGGSGGFGTGGAGTGGSGTGGSGGFSVDAPQDVPQDLPSTDAPRDVIVGELPSTDARDAASDRTDAAAEAPGTDGGVDVAAEAPAETAAETAAEIAAEAAPEVAAETAPEAAAETPAESAPEAVAETAAEAATDTGTTFVAIAPCTTAGEYVTTPTTITFRVGADGYQPSCLRIARGGAVTFSGTFSDHPLGPRTATGGSANTPITATTSGSTQMFTFPNAGFFPYHCNTHGEMIGVIQVTE